MNKIKQIFRSHAQGRGSKYISSQTGISRNTVKEYIRRLTKLGITCSEAEAMPDADLAALILGNDVNDKREPRFYTLQAMLPDIVKALRRKGMTRLLQWELYFQKHPDGYKYSQFKRHIRQFLQQKNVTMHFEHKAGEKAYVDYAGKLLFIIDLETGEQVPVQVFVGILGCSQYTFVEASYTQKKEDFIESCRRMLEFFGGAPKGIVPDNLKAAVSKGSKFAPVLNETFETFGEHYSTIILPARPRSPQDKSLVEGAVKLVYQRIYTRLESQIFTSLAELNTALLEALKDYNQRSLRGEESRTKMFEEVEKNELTPLPTIPYEMRKTIVCTVMKNCHVCLAEDKHYYSVPNRYMGKKVKLLFNDRVVDIFYKYHKIASHSRDKRRHKYTTDKEHLAANQQYVANWSHEFFVAEGNKIAPEVGVYMSKIMESKPHAEQGYKSCAGILHLGRKAGSHRLIKACLRATEYEAYNYPIIEHILNRRLDELNPKEEQIEDSTATPVHPNIRGKHYYN